MKINENKSFIDEDLIETDETYSSKGQLCLSKIKTNRNPKWEKIDYKMLKQLFNEIGKKYANYTEWDDYVSINYFKNKEGNTSFDIAINNNYLISAIKFLDDKRFDNIEIGSLRRLFKVTGDKIFASYFLL